MRTRGQAFGALFVPVLILTAACSASRASEFDQNRAKWSAAHIENYEFDFTPDCLCAWGPDLSFPRHVVVRRDVAVSVTDAAGQEIDDDSKAEMKYWSTMDDIFTWLGGAVRMDPGLYTVTYDPQYGFPAHIVVGEDPQLSDTAGDFVIGNFRVDK